jgi:hypothetical protein
LSTYIKIELVGIKPLIWRRVIVPETITPAKLHDVTQAVMGWSDSHLHEFAIAGERYGIPDPDDSFDSSVISEARAKLKSCLQGTASFRYVYDFGDDWEHKIKVEKVLPPDPPPMLLCVGGANACPPEDVGGPYSYPEFLAAIADADHPEHDEMLEWIGGSFEPAVVNYDAIDQRLRTIKI